MDIPARAAEHYRAMDLASSCRPRETWEEWSREEQADWWRLQNAVDRMAAATFNPDRPIRPS